MSTFSRKTSWRWPRVSSFLSVPWCLTFLILVFSVFGTVSSAHAQYVTRSEVKIEKPKFAFDGWMTWDIYDGRLKPALNGVLSANDAGGLCGRMRLDFYGGANIRLHTAYGGEVCAIGDKPHQWTVDLSSYQSNKLNDVKVSIEKKTASKDWTVIESAVVKVPVVRQDVKITEDGFDFGGDTLLAGAPTTSGDLAWTWHDGKITPRLTGTLHVNNAASACARMRIEYFGLNDERLADKPGGKVCAPDNAHHRWSVDLDPFSDGKLASIRVSLQTLGADGSWRTIGKVDRTYVQVYSRCNGCTIRAGAGSMF